MEILVTNDDGYLAPGIHVLARLMQPYGNVTVVAPKYHQSGMAAAVSMGYKRIAFRDMGDRDGVRWTYLDATPASCVKFALDKLYPGRRCDLVVSGVNHGSNASTASCYSGTLGAAMEAAINGIPAVGVSIDAMRALIDFSVVERHFPALLDTLLAHLPERRGIYYNVNFPDIPAEALKGVRAAHQGAGHWIDEFSAWDGKRYLRIPDHRALFGPGYVPKAEQGEKTYMIVGSYVDDDTDPRADHHLLRQGWATVTAHNMDNTDYSELERLEGLFPAGEKKA